MVWTEENKLYSVRCDGISSLRHRGECQQQQEEGQEEEKWPVHLRAEHRCRRDGTLPPGPVAERGVAAGDAD